jgi:energy-coupling factor transporter transmembrane protein EcfT
MAMLNSTTRPDYFIYFVPSFASLPLLIEHSSKKLIYQLGTFISILLIAFITEWTLGSRELTHYLESIRIPVLGIILLCLMQFLAVRNKIKE